jgi:hypothetical protein
LRLGIEQCYKVQAVAAAESLPVLATEVVPAPNDKQIEAMVGQLGALPDRLGKPETLLADSRLFQRRPTSIRTQGTLNSTPGPP